MHDVVAIGAIGYGHPTGIVTVYLSFPRPTMFYYLPSLSSPHPPTPPPPPLHTPPPLPTAPPHHPSSVTLFRRLPNNTGPFVLAAPVLVPYTFQHWNSDGFATYPSTRYGRVVPGTFGGGRRRNVDDAAASTAHCAHPARVHRHPVFVLPVLWATTNVFHLIEDLLFPVYNTLLLHYGRVPENTTIILQVGERQGGATVSQVLKEATMIGRPAQLTGMLSSRRIYDWETWEKEQEEEIRMLGGGHHPGAMHCFEDLFLGVDMSSTMTATALARGASRAHVLAADINRDARLRDLRHRWNAFRGAVQHFVCALTSYQGAASMTGCGAAGEHGGQLWWTGLRPDRGLAEGDFEVVVDPSGDDTLSASRGGGGGGRGVVGGAGTESHPMLTMIRRRSKRVILNFDELVQRAVHVTSEWGGVTGARRSRLPSWIVRDMAVEDVPFSEQMAVFRSTTIIAAMHGQGATNLAFMPRGGSLLLFLEPGRYGWKWMYANMALLSDIHVVALRRPAVDGDPTISFGGAADHPLICKNIDSDVPVDDFEGMLRHARSVLGVRGTTALGDAAATFREFTVGTGVGR